MSNLITVDIYINKDIEFVWECWTNPKHIVHWYFATEEWHTPRAINDLKEGGTFLFRMEAKDGSMGFDYSGTYTKIVKYKEIRYHLEDGRIVNINFANKDNKTLVSESFEIESSNPIDMQKRGWQSILTNFKWYVENLNEA